MYIETSDDVYAEDGSVSKLKVHPIFMIAVVLCVIGVIVMGVYPEPILKLCETASTSLFKF